MENNDLDWMAVQTQVGDASFADIYNLGVDPTSVSLDTKAVYKDKKKIKENPAFQTDGKFDDTKFDQFYDMSVKTLNAYKSSDVSVGSGNIPEMNLWEDTGLARALKQKTYKDPISVSINTDPMTNLKLAQKSNLGFIDMNQWSDPQKTIAEVAQSQKVIDGLTGKELSYSPEDSGFSNGFGFFSEPLVLSAYDADVKDADGNVVHKRGETKFGADGLPRYETLAGRSASGKQILSRMDTLTKEDSYLNKFDFMDSDGFNKSLTGSIMKTAVNLIPLTIGGPIATAAKAYFIADGLIQAGTEIGKALTGIVGGPEADKTAFYRSLNDIQSFTKQWKSGTSEHAKSNFASMENLLNLASDSVYQLMGQQALSLWPQRVRQYQMAKNLNLNPGILTSLSKGGDEALSGVFEFEKYMSRYGDDAAKAAAALSRNSQALANTGKYAAYGARAFMAATSAVGISDVADEAGLDARDKGLLYLGYTAGLVPLFAANVGHWVEGGHEVDQLAKGMNNALKKYAGQYITPVVKAESGELGASVVAEGAKEAITGLAKLKGNSLSILKAGRDLGARVAKRFDNINTPLMAGLAEGVEEITEEVLQDAVKGIYNGLSSLGFTSTKDKQIDFDLEETMSRYGQAFIGGAIGGMIFKFVDPDVKVKPFISDEMKEYVANGYGDEVISSIRRMATEGQLGSTTLSINKQTNSDGIIEGDVWAPVNKDNPVSQNDFVADRMIKEVRANMEHLSAFGLTDQATFIDGKNKFYDTIVDTRTDTDLRDRVKGASDNLIQLNSELRDIADTDINREAIAKKKEEIKEAKEEFDYLMSDDSIDEYFRQGLFNINTSVNSKFGVKTRQTFTEDLLGSNYKYEILSETDKDRVDTAFDSYRMSDNDTYGIKVDLKNARLQVEAFDTEMKERGGYDSVEAFNESMKSINEAFDLIKAGEENTSYVQPFNPTIDGKPNENVLLTLNEEFYNKIKDVQYVPDFLHDEINSRLTELKTSGLTAAIEGVAEKSNIAVNPVELRQSLVSGGIVSGLNPTIPLHAAFKAYLSKFNPVTVFDSPAAVALKGLGSDADLSAMIKVLDEVDGIQDTSQEKTVYDIRKQAIDSLTPEQVLELLVKAPIDMQFDADIQDKVSFIFPSIIEGATTVNEDIKTEIYTLLNDVNYEAMLDDINEDDLEVLNDSATAVKLLNAINQQKFLNDASGVNTEYSFDSLIGTSNNILIDHALNDTLNNLENSIGVKAYVQIDKQIDEFIGKTQNALKTKATSPLATFLSETYRFKTGEFEAILKGGAANYVNNSIEFENTLNEHIAKTERVSAFMAMLYYTNPVINEWRKNNPDLVPEDLKDEVLTSINPEGYGTIVQASNILLNELKYLRDLNDYNRNNTLAKLLKEDGLQMAAAVNTLSKIESIAEVAEYLPSISVLLQDVAIKEYVDDVEAATDASKIIALGLMAKHEHAIYTEFQGLNSEIKQKLIDLTFKPINSTSYEFRSAIKGDSALNDMHQTLYLAKIYGSSTVEYTKAVAGDLAPEGYVKIADAVMDPFPNQEAAIRLAYLNRFGDPLVYASLVTAYAYKNQKEAPATFNRGVLLGLDLQSTMTVVGDPGVGKTKAIVAGILAFDKDKQQDVVLLGSVNEHVENLISGVTDAGFENRVNFEMSKSIHNFIVDLNLTDQNNKLIKFDTSSEEVLNALFNVSSNYAPSYKDDAKVQAILTNAVNRLLVGVKLNEANGDFNTILAKKFNTVRNIIIDEYTHANPVDVAILLTIVNAYNKSINNEADKKITVILAGDNNQLGFGIKDVSRTFGDFMPTVTSIPLTTSLRSGWDLVNNVLTEVKDRTSQLNDMTNQQVIDPVTASRLRQIPINLNHTIADGNPIGIYREEVEGDTSTEHFRFFRDHIETIKSSPNSLVYVVQDADVIPAGEALMRDLLGSDWKNYASVLTATTTQGREYKYAIIDAAPQMVGERDPYRVKRGYKFLNTMLSRATEATLLIDKGTYADYVSWTSVEVPKAIDQKKLTSEMIEKIKENRQSIAESILTDAPANTQVEPTKDVVEDTAITPETVDDAESIIKGEDEGVEDEPSESQKQAEIPVERTEPTEDEPIKAVAEVMPVLNSVDELALFSEQPIETGEASDDFARTSPYMVNAYTTFTFKRDVDSVKSLLGPLTDRDAETALRPLREWTSYKDFTNNYYSNSQLMTKLKLEGYSAAKTAVRVRAIKRDANFMTVGRSKWNNNYVETPGQDILIIEGVIPNNKGREPFIFTIGTFNSLENIDRYGGDTEGVKSFLKLVRSELAANKAWTSPEFSLREWKDLAVTKEFKVEFKQVDNSFADLRKNYDSNIRITEPLVVIAKSNADTMAKWKKLAGKSVALATEHEALRSMSDSQLYDIYSKQIEYYNNDAFKAMSYEDKLRYINGLPKIPGTTIQPKPKLVQLIQLNNPKYEFTQFITNYAAFKAKQDAAKAAGKTLKTQEEVREFEMSPYVADRLIKSMMVIHRMLTDENAPKNKEWFNSNVLPNTKSNVLNDISTYMAATLEEVRLNGGDFNFGTLTAADFLSSETDATALHSADDLAKQLDVFLYGNPNLIRGVYDTNNSAPNVIKGVDLNPNVDLRKILPDVLTNDKFRDFSSSGVLNVKNLAIYSKLKPSFLKMINETFKALGSIPSNGEMGKYSLENVFKNGLIENIIVAGVGSGGRNVNNVLAPVLKTSLSSGFRTNAASIQTAAFYVNFDGMMEKLNILNSSEAQSAADRIKKEDAERIAANKYYKRALAASGINSNYEGYDELAAMSFDNEQSATEFLQTVVELTLKVDVIPVDPYMNYKVNTEGVNTSFMDHTTKIDGAPISISDNGNLITLVVDYEDSVETITFDKKNGYNAVNTLLFKTTEVFNATDEAKRFIDDNGLTAESVIELATTPPKDEAVALDLAPLRSQTFILDTQNGPKEFKIVSSSIGIDGSMYNSFVVVENEEGRQSIRMSELPVELTSNLEVHSRALQKQAEWYANPENHNYDTLIWSMLDELQPDLPVDVSAETASSVVAQLGLKDPEADDPDERSTYKTMTDLIDSPKTLIVNPWGTETPVEYQPLIDAYTTLAEALYTDNLHNANGFVNNFSIFANGEWEAYQTVIDEAVLMTDPELSKQIIKLEEQLNKLTHDC